MVLYTSVDGDWSDWGEWSVCPVTCGRGYKRRNRRCDSPAPAYGGAACIGSTYGNVGCNNQPCKGMMCLL